MVTLKRKLPGLNGIVTFEAAARHLSFTRAANELHVTQAAVSRQIRRLEEQLGTELFERHHRSLSLTGAGSRLHQAVTMGLEHIANAAWDISRARHTGRVQVVTTVAFASHWLKPRLDRFREAYRDVDVRVLAADRYRDYIGEDVDIILACGDQHVLGQESHFLFSEVMFPVCSPHYLQDRSLRAPADLLGERLLHLDRRHWDDIEWEPIDWSVWLAQFGVSYQPDCPTVTLNNYPMLIQAALEGQGIALGWRHLVEQQLHCGVLVRPLDLSWDSQRGYHLVVASNPPIRPEVEALRGWLLASRWDSTVRTATQSSHRGLA